MVPGTQFGPYRVESLLGAGGMGEVYLATDTRLDRSVAIKILGGTTSGDALQRQRFEREAKLISKLSHPNICALYDLGRQDGVDYLVMEYLQGETLAERIRRGPLTLDEIVRVGVAVAQALERAHRQGIVHRDLKPGNVMLTKSGVKLLDFGLAKLSPVAGLSSESATTFRQQVHDPLTEAGAIVGTFQYMAPEQIEGKEADSRSDLFAFGAILYEMATGRRAFEATSRATLMAAILDQEPPALGSIRPAALERVVRACLAKDPDQRMQSAHDIALELQWLAGTPAAEAEKARRAMPWIATAVAILAAAASMTLWVRARRAPQPSFALSIAAPPGQTLPGPVNISPDGSMVAFAAYGTDGRQALWLRRLDDPMPRILTKTGRTDRVAIIWSPDSRSIAYSDDAAKLMRIRIDGGAADTIATTDITTGGAWGADGTILFSPGFGRGLMRVPASGGDPVVMTKLDPNHQAGIHCTPLLLPGRRLLYLSYSTAGERNRIYGRSLDGGDAHFIIAADALIGYSAPYLFFARDGAIYAQTFDPSSMTLSGDAHRVVDDVRFREPDALAFAWVSASGVLAYLPYEPSAVDFNVYDRSGSRVKTLWHVDDIWPDLEAADAHLSPSGRMLLVDEADRAKGAADAIAIDLSRGVATRLTHGLSTNRNSVWSPDEQSIAFSSDRAGFYDVYVKAADPASPERPIWASATDKHVEDWSPDGRYLLVGVDASNRQRDIWVLPLDPREKPWPLVQSESIDTQPRFSPDGKWIAYQSDESGHFEIYVRPFRGGRTVRVSAAGGRVPTWSRAGDEILFSTPSGDVMIASVHTNASSADVGVPRRLFSLGDIAQAPLMMPDGNILVGEQQTKPTPRIEVTTAWRAKMH